MGRRKPGRDEPFIVSIVAWNLKLAPITISAVAKANE